MKGCFITIEGIEGVGKTTNLHFIESWLQEKGIEYITTREPGGTELGEQLRELLLHGGDVSSEAELLMMFASRSQHLDKLIKPAIDQGKWVVCDRFTDSTYAYQGGGREMNINGIAQLESLVHKDFQPDLTLLLDAPVEIGRARAAKRSAADRIEAEDLAFFNRVRNMFLHRANEHPRFNLVDATQSLEDVQAQIKQSLEKLLQRHI